MTATTVCRGRRSSIAGRQWWPTAEFERKFAMPEQAKRYETDAWEIPIKRYLDGLHDKKTTVLQVALGALAYEGDRPMIDPDPTALKTGARHADQPAGESRSNAHRGGPTNLEWVQKRNSGGALVGASKVTTMTTYDNLFHMTRVRDFFGPTIKYWNEPL